MRPRLPRRSTRALHASASARLVSCTLYGLTSEPREEEAVDACIVGGGPAGLSTAIHLEQLELDTRNEVHVVVLGRGMRLQKYAITIPHPPHMNNNNGITLRASAGGIAEEMEGLFRASPVRRLLSQEANTQDAQGSKVHSVRGVVMHDAGLAHGPPFSLKARTGA
ncbi:hypothetical protein K438DRAFT_1983978 [Mycena galopus ATCC 62051]|nr:hypothetical protein K438DRAFT_1983978 [Mycena galopus ATCC 62051]